MVEVMPDLARRSVFERNMRNRQIDQALVTIFWSIRKNKADRTLVRTYLGMIARKFNVLCDCFNGTIGMMLRMPIGPRIITSLLVTASRPSNL